ncbi:hypothetical protein ACFL6P_00455 [Candidatus Latescibacterota bacterium]
MLLNNSKKINDKMKIYEWEIWHTYSTYFLSGEIDLKKVADNMANAGFGECLFLRDGTTYWHTDNGYQKGFTTLKLMEANKASIIEANTINNEEINATEYSLETWNIAAQFRFCELRIFAEDDSLPPPYLRIFLGLSKFISKKIGDFTIYPIITLYETGVLLVEFRVIGPDKEVVLDTFINDYENLYQIEFDKIECSPTISKYAPSAYHYYQFFPDTFVKRIKFSINQIFHDTAIEELTYQKEDSDFSYELTIFPTINDKESTASFAQTLFSIVGFLINKPEKGLGFLIRRQKFPPKIGHNWIGRPHIHLIKHQNQAETSSKNEKKNRDCFEKILARTTGKIKDCTESIVPKDSRIFDDFSAYITNAVTLWVWSKKGLTLQEEMNDINRGNLVYENQAKTEMLDYGFMIYKRLLERLNSAKDSMGIIEERKNIYDLKSRMENISHFGEIYDLFHNGWNAYGVPKLEKYIKEKISILKSETKYRESKRTQAIAHSLSVLFGLIAVPTFAFEVLKPVWELLCIWHPSNKDMSNIFYNIITLFGTLLIIGIIYKKNK